MSTLGKIFTVLIALVAVALVPLVAREFALGTDYKDLAQRLGEQAKEAIQERDNWITKAEDLRDELQQTREKLTGQVQSLNDAVQSRDADINTLKTEAQNLNTKLQELITNNAGFQRSVAQLVEDRDNLRDARDAAVAEARDLRKLYAELETRYLTVADQVQAQKEAHLRTREQLAAAESQVEYILSRYPHVKLPDKVPPAPPGKLAGLVTGVDMEEKTAQINLGTDDGVAEGMVFIVFDPASKKFLAELTISQVAHDSAAGELSLISGTVQRDSHVTNRDR